MKFKSFSKMLTVLSLTICSCSVSIAGMWFDDFERRSIKFWKIYNLDRPVEKWAIKDGEVVGEIFQPGFMSLLMTGTPDWSNYSVECRAKFVKTSDEASAELGLSIYDGGDENSRYIFFINFSMKLAVIHKVFQGKWTSIIYNFDSQKDTWYKLKASVKEQDIEFIIDDEKRFAVKDEGELIESGQVGLVVANARAHFDDVAITGSKIPSTGPGQFDVGRRKRLASVWGKIKRAGE